MWSAVFGDQVGMVAQPLACLFDLNCDGVVQQAVQRGGWTCMLNDAFCYCGSVYQLQLSMLIDCP
jgi:hypothetical protein